MQEAENALQAAIDHLKNRPNATKGDVVKLITKYEKKLPPAWVVVGTLSIH